MGHGCSAILICSLLTAVPLQSADSLDAVFARMDKAAKTFKGMTADISNTQYTALVDDKNVETGTMKLLLAKDGTHLLANFKGAQVVSLDGHKGRVYNPTTNVVDEADLGGRQAMVNQYLLLGFGATSSELRDSYDVTYAGQEKLANRQTSRIALVPKSTETRQSMKQADLWIGEDGLVVQQKILRPSGDYSLFTYSNITLGAIPEKDLELKPAAGYKIQKH
jgi:outer membrane lipoprotein-sorting protein